VPELIAKPPLGHAALTIGRATLALWPVARMTSVAPFAGQEKAVAQALKTLGLAFPAPQQTVTKGDATLIWTARAQAFLLNADPASLASCAALTDQTDGWAALALQGPQATQILARLIPLDLRGTAFPVGQCARTALNHMNLILWRNAPYSFTLMVFRSMAETAWHEVAAAMQTFAARDGLAAPSSSV
jgi:heterotetrameric sarcosine oxidase gamma subunit